MGKRRYRHPEAVAKEREHVPESTLPRKGWSPDYGWFVIFYLDNGERHTRDYPPGSDIKLIRAESQRTLRESNRYTKAWIIMKDGRRTSR